MLLLVNALPFGATGSVAAFLRISMFIWYLGVVGLHLAWTAFYDDYSPLSRSDCATNSAWAAECLMNLPGVVFAKEGKKATTFDKIFNSLGVVFDLQSISEKLVYVGHTESRRLELVEVLKDTLDSNNCTAKQLERLRGRMLWFENFVCGRQANFLIAKLGKFISQPKDLNPFGNDLRRTLESLLLRVEKGEPIEISKKIFETWLIFTDGACEESATIGGVIVDPYGQPRFMFGDKLPDEIAEQFYEPFMKLSSCRFWLQQSCGETCAAGAKSYVTLTMMLHARV